jgi:hypothetical protein
MDKLQLSNKEIFVEEGSAAERAVENLYWSHRSGTMMSWNRPLWFRYGFDIVWVNSEIGAQTKIIDENKFMLFVLEWS